MPEWGNQLLSRLGIDLSANQVDLISSLGSGVIKAVAEGRITGENLASTLGGYVARQITGDPQSQLQLAEIMKQLGTSIDTKQTSFDGILRAIADGLLTAQQKLEQQAA